MVRFVTILALILLFSFPLFAQGSSIGTAAALGLNTSASGTMNDNSTNHYWKITTSANGYLRVEITSSSSIDVDPMLYDVNGTTTIFSDGRYGTYSELYAFLKPGTYYVKAWRWSGTTGTYTITTTFVSPSRTADTELNDSPSTAVALNPTGTSTGHLGFYSDGATDNDDYWKITTTQDGWLRVQVRSDSLDLRGSTQYDLDLTLYDINGTGYVGSDGRSGTFSQVAEFLRPGTYYVKVHRWLGGGGGYEIKSDFFTPPLANDTEGNDTYQTASTVTVNGSATGHLGYYSNGTTDNDDYWKFTTTSDGKVVVRVVSDSTDVAGAIYDLDLTIYDINGTSYITSDGRSGKTSESIVYLRPGTFYVRIHRWLGGGGSYTLSVTHTPPTLANEGEGNDSYTTASALTSGISSTGHIGYFANGTTDSDDYWKVVAPFNDSIYVHVTSENAIDVDLTAYGPNGTTYLTSDGRYGIYSRVGILATAGSTYYFKVHLWQGTAGSYSIVAVRSSVVSVEDQPLVNIIPTEFALEQNYPNPFNPSTTIRYSLPKDGTVVLSVYSLLGQEVARLQDGFKKAANYSILWNGNNAFGQPAASGIYLVRLQFDNRQLMRKVMLVK